MDLDEARKALTGPVASLPTPFTRDGAIDFPALGNIVDFCIDAALPTGQFSLIYDADPGGDDGEPVLDDDTDDAAPRVRLVG